MQRLMSQLESIHESGEGNYYELFDEIDLNPNLKEAIQNQIIEYDHLFLKAIHERSLARTVEHLDDTGQNGLSDYNVGFTNYLMIEKIGF